MAATTTLLDNLKSDLGTEVNDYDAATTGDDSRRLIKNFDSILDLIQKQRVKASVRADAMIKPGNQSEPLPHPIDTVTALEYTPLEYAREFFNHDAIAKNHNGVTSINVPYNDAVGAIVSMSQFYNQITTGNSALAGFNTAVDNDFVAGAPADALKYYLNYKIKPAVPLKRYEMQEWHYRTNARAAINDVNYYVQNSHSHVSPLPQFDESGKLRTDPDGAHPNPNSFEARSLQTFFNFAKDRSPPIIIQEKNWKNTWIGWKFLGIPAIIKNGDGYGPVPFRILPFGLQGSLVRTTQPTDRLYRPISRHTDVWCKIYNGDTAAGGGDGKGGLGALIPYDRTNISLGNPNVGMVETWDGFVRFVSLSLSSDGSRINIDEYIDQPEGAVIIGADAKFNFQADVQPSKDNIKMNREIKREANEWFTDFYPRINVTRLRMFNATAVRYKAHMFPGGTRMQFGTTMVSDIMGLAMYVYNLYRIGSITLENAQITGGYGSIKKNIKNKTRNMNKRQRQRQRRSKSKSMSMLKSAKRAFYRMNKRNKTSRHYH